MAVDPFTTCGNCGGKRGDDYQRLSVDSVSSSAGGGVVQWTGGVILLDVKVRRAQVTHRHDGATVIKQGLGVWSSNVV